MKIAGREPAVFFGMVASVLMALALLLHLNTDVQSLVNAAILALSGLAAASFVSLDAALPALVGLLKAVFALIVGLGGHLPDNTQVAILAVVTAVAAFWVRTQVTAKVSPLMHAA
jgi:hypothetical protein